MLTNSDINIKVVILGEGQVGKTSIITRYVHDKFSDNTSKTINASYLEKYIKVQDKQVKLCIWDTAGQEEFHCIAPVYYKNSDAAILVYDITNRETLVKVRHWATEIKQFAGQDNEVIMVIVGNKQDLFLQRQVNKEEAEALATQIGAKHFYTSAKAAQGLNEMFQYLAYSIGEKKHKKKKHGKGIQIQANNQKKEQKNNQKCC